jgi:uncharacterized membrane protein YsdA (DUF1294 family)
MLYLKLYLSFLAVMSVLGFVLMAVDKLLAKWDKRRISEKTLLTVGAFGGAAGSWLAMVLFHHKTKHKAFSRGLPLFAILHSVILLVIIFLGFRGGPE